jgi:hypothetical protein
MTLLEYMSVEDLKAAADDLTQPSHFDPSNPVLDIGNAVFGRRSALQIRRT